MWIAGFILHQLDRLCHKAGGSSHALRLVEIQSSIFCVINAVLTSLAQRKLLAMECTSHPLLNFDPACETIIEPGNLIRPKGTPSVVKFAFLLKCLSGQKSVTPCKKPGVRAPGGSFARGDDRCKLLEIYRLWRLWRFDRRIALDEIEYDYDEIIKEIICQT